ncbi:S-adenosylmethionine:tRNA ribosyltransferase-isomerase [Sphingomonas sp. G-3-2-10]|uniref:S-adenosylmethionine:tRNA ribosyltransferase-isomerase n=1 Tax=Sphingomonas sp. G-3-2-10 TaxID=2728838 RepID=UPI0032162A78
MWEVDGKPPNHQRWIVLSLYVCYQNPASTQNLFMLVSALMGLERMQAAYAHAIAQEYRFYSYGDASLLLP